MFASDSGSNNYVVDELQKPSQNESEQTIPEMTTSLKDYQQIFLHKIEESDKEKDDLSISEEDNGDADDPEVIMSDRNSLNPEVIMSNL